MGWAHCGVKVPSENRVPGGKKKIRVNQRAFHLRPISPPVPHKGAIGRCVYQEEEGLGGAVAQQLSVLRSSNTLRSATSILRFSYKTLPGR